MEVLKGFSSWHAIPAEAARRTRRRGARPVVEAAGRPTTSAIQGASSCAGRACNEQAKMKSRGTSVQQLLKKQTDQVLDTEAVYAIAKELV